VVLGVSGGKPAGEGVFGYFDRGELKTTDLGSGIGVHSLVYPCLTVFRAYVLGFYLRVEDMSSPRSEIEWADLFTRPLRTHHPAERGVRAELSSRSAEPYLLAG
jgi:hypothetical protein